MFGPFVDGALLGGDALGIGLVRSLGLQRGGAVIGDRPGERRLFLGVELLEMAALLLPVMRLAALDDEEDGEHEADRDAGDPLNVEEAEQVMSGQLRTWRLRASPRP